jgi:hypothetical protein
MYHGEPIFDETCLIELNKLSVEFVLQSQEQSTPAQVLFCNHHLVLRCRERSHRTNYAEPITRRSRQILGKMNPLGIMGRHKAAN